MGVTPPDAAATAEAVAAAADIGLPGCGAMPMPMFSMFSLLHAPFIVLDEEKHSFIMNGNFVPAGWKENRENC